MSVTINGSGTIGGLTAGGLPDGTVTAADLASTLDLTGKTVTLPAGVGGKVLQVVQGFFGTTNDFTTTTFTDTNVSQSITTTLTSSKILVIGSLGLNASTDKYVRHRLMRNGTAILTPGRTSSGGSGASGDIEASHAMNFLDSPAQNAGTVLTYTVQMKSENGGLVRLNDNIESVIILMELAP